MRIPDHFVEWSDEIKAYCESNGLSFEKAKTMSRGFNRTMVSLCYYDRNKKTDGLRDDTPMPAVLFIEKQPDGSLKFEQTEHTKKYLS